MDKQTGDTILRLSRGFVFIGVFLNKGLYCWQFGSWFLDFSLGVYLCFGNKVKPIVFFFLFLKIGIVTWLLLKNDTRVDIEWGNKNLPHGCDCGNNGLWQLECQKNVREYVFYLELRKEFDSHFCVGYWTTDIDFCSTLHTTEENIDFCREEPNIVCKSAFFQTFAKSFTCIKFLSVLKFSYYLDLHF